MNLEQFVKENISKFNESPNNFKNVEFNTTQIKDYLKKRFSKKCDEAEFKERVLKSFAKKDYKRTKIIEIANEECLYKGDIELFLETQIFLDIFKKLDLKELTNFHLNYIQSKINNEKQFKFIHTKLAKILEKALFVASIDGFYTNLLHINSGIMTANAGDSAEFLFVARAILAGFNASSVDVRSSRYDAIVDYKNTLLRIQVKGISSGELISFKDRDRGGQGIDHKHEKNQGKRITKQDCDIYVAIDKQVGICYIIPMDFADSLSEEQCSKVKLEQVQEYKENWEIIKELAKMRSLKNY